MPLDSRILRLAAVCWKRGLVCLLAFAVSGAAIYVLGERRVADQRTYEATAVVRQEVREPVPSDGPPSAAAERTTEEDLRRQILADINLRRALGPSAGPQDGDPGILQETRQNLHVAVRDITPGTREIAIRGSGQAPEGVVHLVNRLARQYAEEHHTKLEAAARQQHQAAQQEAAAARRQWDRARANLDRLLGECLRLPPAEPPAPRQAVPPPPPATVVNPRWLELDARRAELVRTREELLIDRTPVHPEVRELELRIAELEAEQGTIPQEIAAAPTPSDAPANRPGPESAASTSPQQGTALPSPADANRREAELADLRARVEETRQRYEEQADAERRAREAYQRVPAVEVILAERSELVATASQRPRLLLLALSAALATALGTGMMLLGTTGDTPLATPEQVARAVPVPILGTVPIPASTPAEPAPAHSTGARVTAACGILLILASLAVAVAATV